MVGAPIQPSFALVDHFGRDVTEQSYRGRWQLVYFGFTFCKLVCPRALKKLSEVLTAIGPDADRIAPLYITVDPARDTPARMRAYLEPDYPRFVGLTGSDAAIDAAKSSFRVFAQRKADADTDYQIAHTAIAYLLDRDGAYLDHFPDATEQDRIVERVRRHLSGVAPDGQCAV